MGYECKSGDAGDHPAELIITNLETGDTEGVCGTHLVEWTLSMLMAATGIEWVPFEDKGTETGTGDATDEPEHGDGPTTPAPAESEPVGPLTGDNEEDEDDPGRDDYAEDGLSEAVSREVAKIAANGP